MSGQAKVIFLISRASFRVRASFGNFFFLKQQPHGAWNNFLENTKKYKSLPAHFLRAVNITKRHFDIQSQSSGSREAACEPYIFLIEPPRAI